MNSLPQLPSFKKNHLHGEFDYYGASFLISKQSRLFFKEEARKKIIYSHGWVPDYFLNSDPRIIYGHSFLAKSQFILTSKKSISDYLTLCGYQNVHPIGLPVVYVKETKAQRIKNSLLVMPAHSLDYTTHNHWKFEEYVQEIDKFRKYFKEVCICVHPSCIKNNYWIHEFKSKGYKIIEGVNVYDRNALIRLKTLLESFEYVTTNTFGSLIPYAAFFGAKVSVYGNYCDLKEVDVVNDPFYANNKDLIDKSINLTSQQVFSNYYEKLFVEPMKAEKDIDWGRYEVGYTHKKTGRELQEIFMSQIPDGVFIPTLYNIIREIYSGKIKPYMYARKADLKKFLIRA
jgi:hypothetical protein